MLNERGFLVLVFFLDFGLVEESSGFLRLAVAFSFALNFMSDLPFVSAGVFLSDDPSEIRRLVSNCLQSMSSASR